MGNTIEYLGRQYGVWDSYGWRLTSVMSFKPQKHILQVFFCDFV